MTMTPITHKLTWRQALARVIASVALGTALAVAIVSHGVSASDAKVQPGPTGSAAAQLSVLQGDKAIDHYPPASVSSGFDGASAESSKVHPLGANVDGTGLDLYAAARSNGGACNALSNPKGGVGTTCVDNLDPSGISIGASDASGWMFYGFAADDVVGVDVVVDGKAQPATMLPNSYVADLGSSDISAATALLVHHSDGTTDTVPTNLRAPGS